MQKKMIWIIVGIVLLGIVLLALIWNIREEEISQEEIEKSLLHLTLMDAKGVEHFGSGYILEIDEEKVYICSNAHVLSIAEQGTAYFCNGEQALFTCLGYDEVHDVGIATIERNEISKNTMSQLRRIPVSKVAWESFLQQGGILTMTVMKKDGSCESKTGEAVGFVTNKYFDDIVLQMTIPLVAGNSGSAILNEKGYLVGMAIGEVKEIGFDLQYYAAPLDDIAQVYEALTGCRLY